MLKDETKEEIEYSESKVKEEIDMIWNVEGLGIP